MEELNKKNPFKTPEGYFDGLSDSLRDRLSDADDLLPDSEYRLEDGFKVPQGYFEGLAVRIQQKMEAEEPKVIALQPRNSYPGKKYYYIAASVAAAALAIFMLNLDPSPEITFDDIANSDIETYFEEDELDFSTYEMAEILPIDQLEISDVLSEGLDDESILEYVANNTNNYEDLNLDDEQPD